MSEERLREELERERKRFNSLLIDFENLQAEAIVRRRELAALKAQITKQQEPEGIAKIAEESFEDWRKIHCSRARVFGPARRGKVIARLKENYTRDDLRHAYFGALHEPVVVNGKAYTDIVNILRDEATTDKYIAASKRRDAGFLALCKEAAELTYVCERCERRRKMAAVG